MILNAFVVKRSHGLGLGGGTVSIITSLQAPVLCQGGQDESKLKVLADHVSLAKQ